MKRYEVIKEFLDAFSAYETTVSDENDLTFDNFLNYATSRADDSTVLAHRHVAGTKEPRVTENGKKPETSIAILVTLMYRYAKLYGKKALKGSALHTMDEFSYLIVLLTHESLSKTELITRNVHEKTTGMEILRRLIKSGLVTQHSDDADKRSQRVAITERGRMVTLGLLADMGAVSRIVAADLTEHEKSFLVHTLKKLDKFHFDIFMHQRNDSLESIVATRLTDQ